jgi:cobalt/nickel transport system ATP-binding protein
MHNKETVMEMKDVSFWYNKNKSILKNIDLKIFQGDRVGIIGPNGTGKTTMFFLMSGIEKPKYGEVILFDKRIICGNFRSELGMVFQNTDDQIFNPSVLEDIAFGPRNMGLSKSMIDQRVNYALEILDINKLKNRPPHQLSGGEKRLVAIAGILAMQCKFVIYDEPTSNLDMRYRRKVINFINESNQKAIVIASHDLEFVLEVCNRVIILDGGTIIADGDPKDILSNEGLMKEHSLEVPYSLRL